MVGSYVGIQIHILLAVSHPKHPLSGLLDFLKNKTLIKIHIP
jgi:hypothetical protein